jgi:poly[(R)-3-hydroxyalkanoate] polymerase subunit PhaC
VFRTFFLDQLRRQQGLLCEAAGWGPVRTPFTRALMGKSFVLLSHAASSPAAPPVLLVPAPIKRGYIFDLLPTVSVVQRCIEAGLQPYLMEWRDPAERSWGLADYADASLLACVEEILHRSQQKPVVLGHSLGGTFAALFAARHAEYVAGLVLIEAPLRFSDRAGAFAPMVASAPHASLIAGPIGAAPGTLLDVVSLTAAPEEFLWGRSMDAWAAIGTESMKLHRAVIRWTLDELALPARLFTEVVEFLYRDDRFAKGTLILGGRPVGPAALTGTRILAVVDPQSQVVPLASALDPIKPLLVLYYQREVGVALHHVGSLVGSGAHRQLWPVIAAQIKVWMAL